MNAASVRKPEPGWLALLAQPGARQYLFLALAALAVYCILMSGRTHGPGGNLGTLLTLIITIPGLIGRWAISPALFLILTTYLAVDPNFESWLWGIRGGGGAGPIENLMQAACILVYLMAQFRLLSLLHKSMPDDPPPRRTGQPEAAPRRRPAATFADRELSALLVVALGSILAGCAGWLLLLAIESAQRLGDAWGIKRPFALLVLFFWAFMSASTLTIVFFRHRALQRMSRIEARLMLLDMFWVETRREQERIYRWRRWRRNRRRTEVDVNRS